MDLVMGEEERRRLGAMTRLARGEATQVEIAVELELCRKQVGRVFKRWREEGDASLTHGAKGRPSNRARQEEEKRAILDRVMEKYPDYGPTLAAEALAREGVLVGRETLRGWMKEARPEAKEDWERRERNRRALRPRRERPGELVQVDTSDHRWFEGEARQMLISLIDDATSRIWCRFYAEEGTENNMRLLADYVRRFGRPVAFYTDRATHFAGTPSAIDAESSYRGRRPPSQIARALNELDVEIILARSPQAKGRIERSFRTLQDRLVKALREHGLRTLEGANAYLESTFIPFWNQRFAVQPANPEDAHRPLLSGHDTDAIFSVQEERTLALDHTVSIGGRKYLISLEQDLKDLLPGGKVVVEFRLDGSKRLRHRGRYLKFAPADLAPHGSLRIGNSGKARNTPASPS